jgi:glycoprotein endo-alpha-1,2-mannosidase
MIAVALYLLHFGRQWSHKILPAPRGVTTARWFPHGERWAPPADLCSKHYPALGAYAQTDPQIIRQHLVLIKDAGIRHLVVPFYLSTDEASALHPQTSYLLQGERAVGTRIPMLLAAAAEVGIEVSFLLSDWRGRGSVDAITARIRHLVFAYGSHSSFHPLIFVENPKLNTPSSVFSWKSAIESFHVGEAPVRFMATFQDQERADLHRVARSGFHGVTVEGSERGVMIAERASKAGLEIVAKVSPGRDATKIKPWATDQVIDRRGGQTYRDAWSMAQAMSGQIVLIDSFNDWCAGTQIEPAVSKRASAFHGKRMCGSLLKGLGLPTTDYAYPGYGDGDDPSRYIEITREFTSRSSHTTL